MSGWDHCKDDAIAARRNEAIRASKQREEVIRRHSEAAKKIWSDPEFRARMSEKHRQRWTLEQRAARAESQRGRKHTEEHKAHMREVMKGKNVGKERSEETRRKLSEAGKRSYREGRHLSVPRKKQYRNAPGWHNGTWFRCLNSEGVCARQLDEAGIEWHYEPRRFLLSVGCYTPDFYLPEFDTWLEIKGYMRPKERERIEVFRRETGKTLVVVMQFELESMKYDHDAAHREGVSKLAQS